jgi:hypothetical protein
MKASNLLLGLAPWVLFSLIAGRGADALPFAAGLACLMALVLTIRSARHDGLKIIEVTGVLTFGVLTVIGLAADHHLRGLLADYGRGGAAVVLALVMLVSAFTVPFSEQYARQGIDRRYWASPVFRAKNRQISLVWAGLVAAMAGAHFIAGALTAHGVDRPVLTIALNFGAPVLAAVLGMRATERITSNAPTSARNPA